MTSQRTTVPRTTRGKKQNVPHYSELLFLGRKKEEKKGKGRVVWSESSAPWMVAKKEKRRKEEGGRGKRPPHLFVQHRFPVQPTGGGGKKRREKKKKKKERRNDAFDRRRVLRHAGALPGSGGKKKKKKKQKGKRHADAFSPAPQYSDYHSGAPRGREEKKREGKGRLTTRVKTSLTCGASAIRQYTT